LSISPVPRFICVVTAGLSCGQFRRIALADGVVTPKRVVARWHARCSLCVRQDITAQSINAFIADATSVTRNTGLHLRCSTEDASWPDR
jgi:hypothetical protein